MTADHRSSPRPAADELRLPRAPGVIRRFWARHPRLTDVLLMFAAGMLTLSFTTRGSASALWQTLRPAATIVLVLACAAVLLRRRHPLIFFAVAAAGAVLAVPAGAGIGILVLGMATYTVAVYASSSAAWTAAAIAMGTAAVTSLVALATSVLTWQGAGNGCLAMLVGLLLGALVGVNVGNRKRYVAAILDRSRQLWVEREQHARLAASAERTRIAREMHDVVSHSLTVIVALAEGATATPDVERARSATAQIAATGRGALDEMRAMLGVLRNDDGQPEALLVPTDGDTIRTAVAAARTAGLPVVLRMSGPPLADLHVRLAVARAVQEGLTNVLRHAHEARDVVVAIATTADDVTVEVVNDGVRGHAAPGGHAAGYGLRGLHERAARLGGEAQAGPLPDGRWRLSLRVPAPEPSPAPRGTGEAA